MSCFKYPKTIYFLKNTTLQNSAYFAFLLFHLPTMYDDGAGATSIGFVDFPKKKGEI